MKAVVFEGPGNVHLTERTAPTRSGPDDVLLRVVACGLCGTDQRVISIPPKMGCENDRVIGHEISAVVKECPEGSGLEVGDLVVVAPNYPCRRCDSCRKGYINLCDSFTHVGSQTDGGLAEFIAVPREFIHKVPDGVDPVLAALAEPLACVLNGTERAQWSPGSPVVILGAGPIGLLFLTVAKLAGASPIVVSEPTAERAALASKLGADLVVDPRESDSLSRILEETGGAHVVVDTLGTLMGTAVRVAGKRAQILVFGIDETAEIGLKPAEIVGRELTVEGVYIARGTFPKALTLLSEHPDRFDPIVTDRIALSDWDEAARLLLSGNAAGKIMITP